MKVEIGIASTPKEADRSSIDVEFTFESGDWNSQHTQGNKQIKMGEFTPKSMLTHQSFA
ncbi:hypothetical protein IGW68_02410 [Shewanella benthica]|uniref:hypothetical protein n=1 Tax=Shewanella benthica TaxID=43661 RepID=UPI001879FDA0|nr:hypothetical protein [Shewanella benthica]MBE7214011.1 hypothetical protein [Shewanella benthica]